MNELTLNEECAIHELIFHKTKTRQDILDLGEYVENHPDNLGKDPFPLFHTFADGMYTREMHVPAGALIVGAIHKNEYFVTVLKGRIWVINEFGGSDIQAPASFTAKAGVKNIGYVLEDLVWSDIHKTDKTTIEEAENDILASSYEELDEYLNIYTFNEINANIKISQAGHYVSTEDNNLKEMVKKCQA